ncbi:helix-turn-helix domain-containing protein [Streptomyces sp. NRRL S-340]|uniref:helix-turn-helix domain-containing protein n=1 Tax=Streptomyces sp. NRRL S-340 TaxID=1463901 RepID=UPI000561FB3B|nr:helix-turn-helix transcriptional regulator [Streptomyces sp. NRRL S-340]BFD83119.1 helix-turn-helix transcriptional regulator [Streptomyces sp. Xyl84]
MPARKDPDASTSVPSFYGAELRFKRESAGLTLEQLAEGSFRGISFLSQIERGERRMPVDLARHVDDRLGTDGFFQRRCEDVAKARQVGHAWYYADIPDMEKRALTVEEWAPIGLPGLLQTGAYLRGRIECIDPEASPEEVEKRVHGRLARGELWECPDRPTYWGIVRESAIRQAPVPPAVMAEQVEHILDIVRSTRSVIQVVPETSFWCPLDYGMVKIMTFADAPPLVYTEGDHTGQLIDYPAEVATYRRKYDLLRAVALSPQASLALMKHAARTYKHEAEQMD